MIYDENVFKHFENTALYIVVNKKKMSFDR